MTKLFDDNTSTTIEEELPEDPFQHLVGDDKKFKTPQDLAKAKLESDRFIEQLKGELAGIREELNTRIKVSDAVDKLLSKPAVAPAIDSGTPPQSPQGGEGTRTVQPLSLDDVENLLKQREAQVKAEANVARTRELLQQTYGNEWKQKLSQKLTELGESQEFFQSLAERNPNAVISMLGAPQPKAKEPSLFGSSVNTTNQTLTGKTDGVKNKAYYDAIKAKDPRTYWTPKVQNEMHEQAIKLGDSFFN